MNENDTSKIKSLGNLPISFEENIGQKDEQIKFLARGRGYTAFFRKEEVTLVLKQAKSEKVQLDKKDAFLRPKFKEQAEKKNYEYSVLKLKMEGANPDVEITGEQKLEGKTNYFIGNDPEKWITDVPSYEKIKYRDIYPGIDLVFYGQAKLMEHDFIVKPGADPEKISLSLDGAEKTEVDEAGNLIIKVKTGELRLLKPRVYQEIEGTQKEIDGFYKISAEGKVGFNLGEYDKEKTLKIDPVLVYSTFLNVEYYLSGYGYGIAVDAAGNAYVTGMVDFEWDPQYGGSQEIFAAKLNATGTGIVYTTFLGGNMCNEVSYAIAVDSEGNAYITGWTDCGDFPTTPGAYDRDKFGDRAVFVTKLNAYGNGLVYSTFLDGFWYQEAYGIAVDASRNAYVTGITNSFDFPTTPGAYDRTLNGYYDVFVTKLNASGTGLVYSTLLGGSDFEESHEITVDAVGNAYVTGYTWSSNFPTTPGAYNTSSNGDIDVFVTKLNADGTGLLYSTFLGGSNIDEGYGITVDASGNAYVTGYTWSSNFPTTPGAYDTSFNGEQDVFVTKLNADGTGLVYSTLLGGSSFEEGHGISVDAVGNAYVTGWTQSPNFPTTPGAYDTSLNGDGDVFVTKLNTSGTGVLYSTFLGGGSLDYGNAIALDASGNAYVTGVTRSYNFPTTEGAYDRGYNGSNDVFAVKLNLNSLPQVSNYDVTTQEDTSVSGTVVATDPDGDTLTYSLLDSPSHGTAVVNSDGTWTYTPDANYNGTDSFTVKVDDEKSEPAVSIINIIVISVNEAPIVDNYDVTTSEDTSVSGAVVASDPNGDTLTYSLLDNPAHGTAIVNPDGTWTYTPDSNYNGNDSFTVKVDDGNGGTAASTINITVTPVNDAPTVGNYEVTTAEDTPVSGAVVGTDIDGDALTYSLLTSPAHGTALINSNGSWNYTPAADYYGTDSFKVKVDDGNGGTAISTINITIIPEATTITVTAPDGGETWKAGKQYKIMWDYKGKPGTVNIDLLRNGTLVYTIAQGVTADKKDSGSYKWSIPKNTLASSDYKIRITSTAYSSITDTSDNNFAITGSSKKS